MITEIENREGTFIPMSPNDRKSDIDSMEIFEKYHETFYKDLHGWRDYELTSKG
jgi:acyl-ACP thioesterase